jgi:lipid-binding SYLF domain-containing protein
VIWRGTLRENLDDNATLYEKRLENSDIVTKGVRPPKAAAKLLELLNRYSTKEQKVVARGGMNRDLA